MTNFQLSVLFFLQLAFILAVCRAVGWLARLIKQPQVVGEMIAGVLLGPSLFGLLFPEAQAWMFPKQSMTILFAVSQVGLSIYMFLVGMEFRQELLHARLRSAASVSLAGMVVPFALGALIALWLVKHPGFFGERTPNQRVVVGGSGRGNDAEFVTQDIPGLVTEPTPFAVVQRGANFHVTVMLKNAGTTTWKAGVHRLISQRPRSNLTWFIDRVELSPKEEIRPGEFKSFSFTALAPSQPGIYDFEWQMSQDGIGVFGKPSQTVKITVR